MLILLSNILMVFIILATGLVLFSHGITKMEQTPKALEPLAGKSSYLIFAIGVLGTRFLAIPVLAGFLLYPVSETFGWRGNLDKKYFQA